MPALYNLAAHLALGSALALTARRSEGFRQDPVSWPLILLFAFHALVAAPAATYLFRFFPQWSMLYAFDPQVFPHLERWIGPISGGVVVLNLGCSTAGYFIARAGILRGSRALEASPLVLATVAWIALLVSYPKRTFWVGSYDAYWQADAPFLFATLPGVIGWASYGLGLVFLFWVRRRFGEHEPSYV